MLSKAYSILHKHTVSAMRNAYNNDRGLQLFTANVSLNLERGTTIGASTRKRMCQYKMMNSYVAKAE